MAAAKKGMPKWTKSPQELVELFDMLVMDLPDMEKRKMFGYPVAFHAGHMFCGLFQDRMMIRLSEADRATLIQQYAAIPFEPIPGRPMREYVEVPEKLMRDPKKLRAWLAKSIGYASTLPVKTSKPKGTRAHPRSRTQQD